MCNWCREKACQEHGGGGGGEGVRVIGVFCAVSYECLEAWGQDWWCMCSCMMGWCESSKIK